MFCIALSISSYISLWKFSHLLDDQDKLIWKQPSFKFLVSWMIWDPMINSPLHKDWQLLSPQWKHKQRIFLSWQWWEISQVQHLTTGNKILNSYTWNNIFQQVLFQEVKIYNNLQADLYVQKFHIHLLSKSLVSKINQKNDPLSMDPE